MKMSSWIFLLISALLIISGLFLCNYARSIAPNDAAIDGNITSEDGQTLSELDYSDSNISTLSLSLENCDVEIRGAKEAKVELLGFAPNSFINSVSNKTLRVSNQIELLDYLNFDGSGVQFTGVWQTLLSIINKTEAAEQPQVIIHIPDDFEMKQYSLSFTDCTVRVLEVGGECDLALYATKSTVEFNDVTASMVDFECEDSDISIMASSFTHFDLQSNGGKFQSSMLKTEDITVSGDEGDITMLETAFREFDLEMETCEITLDSIYTQGSYHRSIEVEKGEIYLGELLIGTEDASPDDEVAPGSLTIALQDGKVVSQYGSEQLPSLEEEDPSAEGESDEDEEDSDDNGENSSSD